MCRNSLEPNCGPVVANEYGIEVPHREPHVPSGWQRRGVSHGENLATKFHELHEDRLAVPPSSCIASLTLYTVCDRINFRVIRGKSFRSRFFPWRLRPNLSRGFAPCSKAPTEKRRHAGHYQF